MRVLPTRCPDIPAWKIALKRRGFKPFTKCVKKHMGYIVQKSDMNKREVELLFRLFIQYILLIPEEDIKLKMNEAVKIMKDIDINDSPILACALAVTNDGIWSEDKHLEKQNKIKVWKTKDLLPYL